MQGAKWNPQRFDSSLSQSLWLCPAAMMEDAPGYLVNPKQAKALERKGFALFKDVWDLNSQTWTVEENRLETLSSRERNTLNQALERIKPSWPTSQLDTVEPSVREWKLRSRTQTTAHMGLRAQKVADAWCKQGCLITREDCRKKMRKTWKATSSLRLNMLLWRVLCRKLPVKELTSKWGTTSPMCPRCLSKVETLKHSLWDCYGVQTLWKKCSNILEKCGFTERISWRQALLGAKGRMNPAFFKVWQFIRAVVISKIWYDRNLLMHHKPGLNLEAAQVQGWILEAGILAKERKSLSSYASIMIRKVKKL